MPRTRDPLPEVISHEINLPLGRARYCVRVAHREVYAMTVPGYWQHETGGELRPAIEAYLTSEPMTDQDPGVISPIVAPTLVERLPKFLPEPLHAFALSSFLASSALEIMPLEISAQSPLSVRHGANNTVACSPS